ncbi:MAG TPA: sigma-70 family RNA polymerase sigma factor [Polyangiaceae bacterium]
MDQPAKLDEQLFRQQSARLVAALTRLFGVHNLQLVEDVVQDAFSRALELWQERGVPENPTAWLTTAAKHRALDLLRRERTARTFAPELGRLLDSEWTLPALLEEAFSAPTIRDEQLRMMLSCCHPRLPEEARLALILNVLCGFGAREIAEALLSSQAAIEKRIARGKQALAAQRRLFDLTHADFEPRSQTVRRALYLLFSEGYHGASPAAVQSELCHEALRLALLLCEYPPAATPTSFALCALMSLQAARLPARLDASGELCPFLEQDRSRWDARLVALGLSYFERSAAGNELSQYHTEAAIAATHASAAAVADTDWHGIVSLYDRLLSIAPSPVAALNRAIAIGQRDGPTQGLAALGAIEQAERLSGYPFYAAAFGELERRRGELGAASAHYERALSLARNEPERRFLRRRLAFCGS